MKNIYNKILLNILFILLINFLVATSLVVSFTRRDFDANLKQQLYNNAMIARELVLEIGLDSDHARQMDRILKNLGKELGIRVTVIQTDGIVHADSFYDPEDMENHLYRIEVQAALMGQTGMDTRISPTLGIPMTYLAIPLLEKGEIRAIVRNSLPQETIQRKIHQTIYKSIFLGTLVGILTALLVTFFVARSFSNPIRLIKEAAVNISNGDFNYRLKLERKDELYDVAESLNEMSYKLNRYFDSINQEKERIKAILKGMNEALLLVDSEERIQLANDAFCKLLTLQQTEILEKKYWETILDQEISGFIRDSLDAQTTKFREITLRKNESTARFFHLSASPVLSTKLLFRGIVVIFHDITTIKEMEKMRREFVDNASHELKTPISSILAVSETLLDREPHDAQTRQNFYQTIHENISRLNRLITDLLSLSEIEQKKTSLELKPHSLCGMLNELKQVFEPALEKKNQTFECICKENMPPVSVDIKSFLKALGNLLDNAIRYTDKGGKIRVIVEKANHDILIKVEDNGIGIPPEDISRIFERFYRVDKARSIKLGGTGLGLSIARHIIEAHGGRITVSSTPGKGSVFTITLPI